MLPGDVYISASNTASNRFNPTTAAVVIATVQQSASQPGASDEVLVYTQDGSASPPICRPVPPASAP